MGAVICTTRDQTLTLRISGSLDFEVHREFHLAYTSAPQHIDKYEVDLTDATRLDSSGLGMLLLLRDHAGGDKDRVHLVNASAGILSLLRIAHFDALFSLQPQPG